MAFSMEMIDRWKDEPVIGKDEFETLRLTFSREAKVEALKEFLNKIDEEAGNADA